MIKRSTLCLVYTDTHVLLGMKKRGFGQGRWNGFGGKIKEGETIEDAALRELEEESGIKLLDIEKRGILNFSFEDDPDILEVHVFSGMTYNGEPRETEEMRPEWFKIMEEIPFSSMWPDDTHWLPWLLSGKNFKGKFHFQDSNTLISHELEEMFF